MLETGAGGGGGVAAFLAADFFGVEGFVETGEALPVAAAGSFVGEGATLPGTAAAGVVATS